MPRSPKRSSSRRRRSRWRRGRPDPAEELPDGVTPSLAFQKSGVTAEQPPELTVLEVAEEAGVVIPFECRSGICGQCKTRLISGKVKMAVQDALTPHDRSKGLILPCQAHATRDCVFDV
jgi:ferredoxin